MGQRNCTFCFSAASTLSKASLLVSGQEPQAVHSQLGRRRWLRAEGPTRRCPRQFSSTPTPTPPLPSLEEGPTESSPVPSGPSAAQAPAAGLLHHWAKDRALNNPGRGRRQDGNQAPQSGWVPAQSHAIWGQSWAQPPGDGDKPPEGHTVPRSAPRLMPPGPRRK